jgi:hypothetical protein
MTDPLENWAKRLMLPDDHEWPRNVRVQPPVSDAQALIRPCPLCGAEPLQPCVYVLPAHMVGTSPQPVDTPARPGDATRAVRARVGQPTKRPHNARRTTEE